MNFTTLATYCVTICLVIGLSFEYQFKTCKRKQSEFKTCVSAAVEDALKQLKKPIPEFDLPSFNPLNITKQNIPASHKIVSLEEHVDYINIYGITDAKIKNLDINFDLKTIHLDFLFSNLTLEASLNFAGEVLGEHVHFKGHVKAVELNASFIIQSKFEEYQKDNKKYIKIVDGQLVWNTGNDTPTFTGADKVETEHYTKLVKEHHDEIIAGIAKDYGKIFFASYSGSFNKILAKISVTELFGA